MKYENTVQNIHLVDSIVKHTKIMNHCALDFITKKEIIKLLNSSSTINRNFLRSYDI